MIRIKKYGYKSCNIIQLLQLFTRLIESLIKIQFFLSYAHLNDNQCMNACIFHTFLGF